MIDVLQTAEAGLVAAAIYLLLGLSWNIVYNTSGFLNLTIGEVYVVAAALAATWRTTDGWTSVIVSGIAVVAAVCAGAWVVDRLVLRKLTERRFAPIIATVGVALMLSAVARRLLPDLVVRPLDFVDRPPFNLGGVVISAQELILLGVSASVAAAVIAGFRFTGRGRLMRACADDRGAAIGLGINVPRLETLAFVLGCAIVAVTAVVVAPLQGVSTGSGEMIAIKSFLAVSLVGVGRYGAAVFGALAVGMLEAFVARYATTSARDLVVLSVTVVTMVVSGAVRRPFRTGIRRRMTRPASRGSRAAHDTT